MTASKPERQETRGERRKFGIYVTTHLAILQHDQACGVREYEEAKKQPTLVEKTAIE